MSRKHKNQRTNERSTPMETKPLHEVHPTSTPSGGPLNTDDAQIRAYLFQIETAVKALQDLGALDRLDAAKFNLTVQVISEHKVTEKVAEIAVGAKDIVVDAAYITKHATRVAGHSVVDGTTYVGRKIGSFFGGITDSIKLAAEKGRLPYEPPKPTDAKSCEA